VSYNIKAELTSFEELLRGVGRPTDAHVGAAEFFARQLVENGMTGDEARCAVEECIDRAYGFKPTSIVPAWEFGAEPRTDEPALWGSAESPVVVHEGISVLAGEGGVGKTTLAVNLAIRLASGRPESRTFLGIERPSPAPVLYLTAEGNRDVFRSRFKTAAESLGEVYEDLVLFFAARGATLSIATLEPLLDEIRPQLTILDTVGLFHDGEENSATDWKAKVIKPLRVLMGKYRTAFLLLHHQSKPVEGREDRHRTRGTSAIRDDADSHLILKQSKTAPAERILVFDKLRGAPREAVVLRYDGAAAVFERTEKDPNAGTAVAAVVEIVLAERGEIVETKEILAAVKARGFGRNQAEEAIQTAHRQGLIERRARGRWVPPGGLITAEAPALVEEEVPF